MSNFVHLHTHSYYSLLAACPSPEAVVQRAAAQGMPAVALTDSNALYGAVTFHDACQTAGVQPIIGMDLSLACPDDQPDHLVLLATTLEGYANLCRLSSLLQTQENREQALQRGIAPSSLQDQSAGLIALGGTRNSYLERLVRLGRDKEAEGVVRQWINWFGIENTYLAPQGHHSAGHSATGTQVGLAHRLGVGVVATTDVRYLDPEGAAQARLLAAIRSQQPLSAIPPCPGMHFASTDEMVARFSSLPEALDNTLLIAERCRMALPLGQPIFPQLDLPPGQTPTGELWRQVQAGAESRYGAITTEVQERIEREIAVIDGMGYTPLFLIVADIVAYARREGVPINLRGSAAGSLVAYCLGISSVDPIELGLYFERFLNPGRRDPPDIDLDLCSRRRDRVIRYVYERYGHDRVATICTFTRLRARSAWREVAKASRISPSRIEAIAKQVPRMWHPGMRREAQAAQDRLLASIRDPQEREALDAALALDGLPRHLSVHPGGIVIAPGPLTDRVPLQMATKGLIITQYDLHSVERMGLVKIDLLGIRALTVIAESVALVQRRQPGFDLETVPIRDPRTGERLAQAQTIGCFQIESHGMRRTLRELGTQSLNDVAASLALYKPGPLKGGLKDAFVRRHRGQEPDSYLHASLIPILQSTHGVILYQEQVLRIAHKVAGFDLVKADQLRRAIAHLGHGDELVGLREEFVAGANRVSGIPLGTADRLWEMMANFSGYGFLKAHASSYAMVAYRSAYLKAHYPAEFMTAILGNWGGYYPQRVYLGEARRLGLALRPPHVNHSERRFTLAFTPDGQAILWMGLGQVRELTRKSQAAIIAARREQPFTSLNDLLQRGGIRLAEAENLVRAGALDELGAGRRSILHELEGRRSSAPLQLAFDWDRGSDLASLSQAERLRQEIEMLGWPVSAHPLAPFADRLKADGALSSDCVADCAGKPVTVAGARMSLWRERRGTVMMEDQGGLFRVQLPASRRLPPGTLGKLGPYIIHGRVRVDRNSEALVIASQVEPL